MSKYKKKENPQNDGGRPKKEIDFKKDDWVKIKDE